MRVIPAAFEAPASNVIVLLHPASDAEPAMRQSAKSAFDVLKTCKAF
jgi:hypothetical protein